MTETSTLEFQKYKSDDNYVMECGTSGLDLDIKVEMTKIKYKLMNEIKKMNMKFKNVKCEIVNYYSITNDAHNVDTQRVVLFIIVNEKNDLNKFDDKYNEKIKEILKWYKSDIEEFKGEHKHPQLKEMSYSKIFNKGFNVVLTMNNRWNNWFINLFRDIFKSSISI